MLKSNQLSEYEEVWAFDTEFGGGDLGERYRPVCVTAFELRSGRTIELRRDQFRPDPALPCRQQGAVHMLRRHSWSAALILR